MDRPKKENGIRRTHNVMVRFKQRCLPPRTPEPCRMYDKSNGFYRRQLLPTTREKPVGWVDDPFLIDKMLNEKEDILLWAMEQDHNILGFLKSEGYFEIRQRAKRKSTDFYKVYERWCLDNLESPVPQKKFSQFLLKNTGKYGLTFSKHIEGKFAFASAAQQ